MAKIEKATWNAGKDVGQLELWSITWEGASVESSLAGFAKAGYIHTLWSSSATPGIYSTEKHRHVHQNTHTTTLIVALFKVA